MNKQGWFPARIPTDVSQIVVDILSWTIALYIALSLRFDFSLSEEVMSHFFQLALITSIAQLMFGGVLHLYRSRLKIASWLELKSLIVTTLVVAFSMSIFLFFGEFDGVPRGLYLSAAPIYLLFSGGVRVLRRTFRERAKSSNQSRKAIIYGAGSVAETLIPQLISDKSQSLTPVGLIDDDPSKKNRWLHGTKIYGGWKDFDQVVERTSAEVLIICISQPEFSLLKLVEETCMSLDIELLVFPGVVESLRGKNSPKDLRSVTIDDIVARRSIQIDIENISNYIAGKRVLVTGAGGSIGAELCQQISALKPSKLMLLDRDETLLQNTQILISGNGLLESEDLILADIRDKERISSIFAKGKPEVVFHAAALKHLPLLEKYPDEAYKSNVEGTLNVLTASAEVGVSTFVNISTDKAADPTSYLGKSKKLAEELTAWFAASTGHKYLSVRFGNVLGSRGSMIPTFETLITRNLPITITDPEVTRFFMTIPEACELVLQSGTLGAGQEVLILDMGSPVSILEIANRMIYRSRKNIEVVFTGLRPGEKLHEELYGSEELRIQTEHPLISKTKSQTASPTEVENRWRFEI